MQKHSQFGKYLIYWTSIVVTLLLLTGGLNWFVDPFGIHNSPKIEGLNVSKPPIDDYSRLFKAYNVEKIRPSTVILGSSLAWVGIDPEHPAWSYPPVYNLAFNSAGIYEIERYLQHANNVHQLKQAVIMLDFYAFNTLEIKQADFEEAYLSVSYSGRNNPFSNIRGIITTLFSFDALWNTFITVTANFIGWQQYIILENGLQIRTSTFKKDYHDLFITVTSRFIRPVEYYQFDESHTYILPFEAYRKILKIAYQDNIDLRLVISPFHVYHWETLAARGLWPEFETWKRMLVSINQEESQLAGKTPLPLWDFAEYNEFTTEEVPPSDDNTTVMQWYIDSAHFTKALGDLMLDRIFGYPANRQELWDNFGTLLTVDNIEEHISHVRKEREQYRQAHPIDIAEIENLVKDLKNEKP